MRSKFYVIWLICLVLTLSSCIPGGTSSPGEATAILPNDLKVVVSPRQFNLDIGEVDNANGTLNIIGGAANSSYSFVFANSTRSGSSMQEQPRGSAADNNGISVTTSPTPCTLGTTGTELPTSCAFKITNLLTTPLGEYKIALSAVDSQGTIIPLSPISLVVNGSTVPSAKAIVTFSINNADATISGQNISLTLPYATNLRSLVATYITTGDHMMVNGVKQVDGVTANDFTKPVEYVVHADDGSIAKYTVTVGTAEDSAKAITAFSIDNVDATINGKNIALTLPFGTSPNSLIASFVSSGKSVTVNEQLQISKITTNNFTQPVEYTVHAVDGTTSIYRVTVTIATSSEKAITAFSIDNVDATISGKNIALTLPFGTSPNSLIASFVSSGKNVKVNGQTQTSEVTPNNFTSAVVYTVTAADNSTTTYTVTVTVALNTAKAITAFSLNGTDGVISGQNIAVTMPFGTDITALIATFTTSGTSVSADTRAQTSEVTPNNFTSAVVYTVTAADNSTATYTVMVTVVPPPLALTQPSGIAINSYGTIAYIANSGANTVSQCAVNISTGALSGCINSGGTGFDQPMGITLNTDGTIAYVANYGGGTVSQCVINSQTGALSGCVNNVTIFTYARNVALNTVAYGPVAYVAPFGSSNILQCMISQTGGLSGCVDSDGTGFNNVSSITLNAAGTIAYVGGGYIAQCAVNISTGALIGCVNSVTVFGDFITLNPAGTIAYLPSLSNNSITRCVINSQTGALNGCV